ncbi:3534_t:CDS:1, partial [Dentiscutata erythropus]
NNRYYMDIVIDHETLLFLPENSSVNKQITQVQNNNDLSCKDENNIVIHTFVSSLLSVHKEDVFINNAIEHVNSKVRP